MQFKNSGQLSSTKSEATHHTDLLNRAGSNPDPPLVDGSLMEKVLQRRSLQMRNMQRAWEVHFYILFQIIFIFSSKLDRLDNGLKRVIFCTGSNQSGFADMQHFSSVKVTFFFFLLSKCLHL